MLFFSDFIFHIDIVYECIVLRSIVENKLTYLLTYLDEPRYYVEQFKAELDEAGKDIRFLHTVLQPSDTSHK